MARFPVLLVLLCCRAFMSPDLQREFQLLSANAKQQLMDVPASGSYRHVFSLWILPSFTPSSRWTVYSPSRSGKGNSPFASYTVWRSDLDMEKFKSPVDRLRHPKDLAPTIENDTVLLTGDDIENFVQRIRGISIPFFLGSPSVVGCDGTSFKFHYDELFLGGSLHWWEDRPLEWHPFTDAVMKIAKDLQDRQTAKGQQGIAPEGKPLADIKKPDTNYTPQSGRF
jgi:hypothetical protein